MNPPEPANNPEPEPKGLTSFETEAADREARIAWWRDARFGMFIHWGLYSLPAGEWEGKDYWGIGEWIMFKARIPVAEYEALAADFNPVDFDAEAWAQLAQDAGMKYMVITAKHHDGFAMFQSEASAFNIVDATPFGRDPIRELAAACARRDIRFGVYYSQAQDWHAPGGAIWPWRHEAGPQYKGKTWDPRQEGDFDAYLARKAIPQVKELLTNYGPICILWFDTPVEVMTPERSEEFTRTVRTLQPDTLINGRLAEDGRSDYGSEDDNGVPNQIRPGDWETPATLNDTWGFKTSDENWKEPADLVFNLVDIVSKGGNYLLNVGPDAKGVIPKPSRDILRSVGAWLRVNGEAIYGAGPSPFGEEFGVYSDTEKDEDGGWLFQPWKDWRCTSKPGRLYVHVFRRDGPMVTLPAVTERVTRAWSLSDPVHPSLAFEQTEDALTVVLPEEMPGEIATVICLEFEGG